MTYYVFGDKNSGLLSILVIPWIPKSFTILEKSKYFNARVANEYLFYTKIGEKSVKIE